MKRHAPIPPRSTPGQLLGAWLFTLALLAAMVLPGWLLGVAW